MAAILEILSTGVGLSVQDEGRVGWRRFGVPVGGAMDCHSMRAANQLLGNLDSAPVIEVMLQGAKLRVLETTWLALAGADLGCVLKPWEARLIEAGTVLSFPGAEAGIFTYIAVPGGVVADQWFGSAAADARNGMGEVLKKGGVVSSRLNLPMCQTEQVARRLTVQEARREYLDTPVFGLLRGPQFKDFSESAQNALVDSEWTVSLRSDRTGFRLAGPRLEVPASILSEPVLPGSFQVPGNGQPIVTMVDGPTVGGYAKLAVLPAVERDRLAQCRPGTHIRFQWLD
ncbi:MAG: biotin-dependent carboxyltransferase family protein [Opitutaceae bacterium]